jgi:catalase
LYTPVKLHGACTKLLAPLHTITLPNVDQSALLQEFWRILDFLSFHPESAHILTFLLDDIGIPKDYRHMDGFGVHTFKFTKEGAEKYVKFHWHTDQGVENLTDEEAITVGGTNQGHATADLFNSIKAGEFPSWTLKVQIMDPADEVSY